MEKVTSDATPIPEDIAAFIDSMLVDEDLYDGAS